MMDVLLEKGLGAVTIVTYTKTLEIVHKINDGVVYPLSDRTAAAHPPLN